MLLFNLALGLRKICLFKNNFAHFGGLTKTFFNFEVSCWRLFF